jgi:hypothetical protein
MFSHRAKVISPATQYKVSVVSDQSVPLTEGGPLSYGTVEDQLSLVLPTTWIASSMARARWSFPFRFQPS